MTRKTPAELGYRMPAEWEPRAATWLAWPHQRTDWPGKLSTIAWVYTEIIRHLHIGEKVNVLVRDEAMKNTAERYLLKGGIDLTRIGFWMIPTNRSWMRDSGPMFVLDAGGNRGMLDWRFNGWAKYEGWREDDAVPEWINRTMRLPIWKPKMSGKRMVLEGGSIDLNGEGMLLTTEECLLSEVQERNKGLDRADYEKAFADFLGVRKTIWLNKGIVGDDTHGHVDDLARFVSANTIVCVRASKSDVGNHAALEENWERLHSARNLKDRKFAVVALPMPEPLAFNGQRLPASYANFYIGSRVVLVPTFNDPNDRVALGILAELFPGRKVVGIHAVDLVLGLGTLHCMTQQEPA